MVVGDEGSAFSIARMGLVAALRGADGRGPATVLLPLLLAATGAEGAAQIPPWVGRAAKAQIAALAPVVLAAADEGDAVAAAVAGDQAREAARHVHALAHKLEPWSGPVPVVFHGGTLSSETYRALVLAELAGHGGPYDVLAFSANPVAGALACARRFGTSG
jgi:N-acetylglucosamine kinase-like BadF-type ATPase